MPRPFRVACVAACFVVAAPALPDERIVAQPLRSGAKVVVTASCSLEMEVVAKDGERVVTEFDMPGSNSLSCTATVIEADESGCTKGSLAFGEAKRSECDRLGAPPEEKALDCSRRDYDVERNGSGFVFRSERGDLSRDEREAR